MDRNSLPYSRDFIGENIVQLRRFFGLSQKQFIARFLSDENGTPLVSSGTYSNLEHSVSAFAPRAAHKIAEILDADEKVFELNPDTFFKNLELITSKYRQNQSVSDLSHAEPLLPRATYTENLVRIFSDYLSDGLMRGTLKPRDKLPSDRDLAQQFHVSRSTVREALRVLALTGMLEIVPGQGTFIASDSTDFFLAPLSWSVFMGSSSVADVLTMRNLLEVGTARLAAELATEDDLSALDETMKAMEKACVACDFKTMMELDMSFHLMICRFSRNKVIYELLNTTRKLLKIISDSGMTTVDHLHSVHAEHKRIYEAIRAGDAHAAGEAMNRHLTEAHSRYQIK